MVVKDTTAGGAASVAGNTAVMIPELVLFVAEVAPGTVKVLAVTPVRVYPFSGVKVMVAV